MGLVYLMTPYSKLPDLDAAAREAARLAAHLVGRLGAAGVFSPIAHSHAMAPFMARDPRDSAFWCALQLPFIKASSRGVVAMMPGWRESAGITAELAYFQSAGKPVDYLDPETLELHPRAILPGAAAPAGNAGARASAVRTAAR